MILHAPPESGKPDPADFFGLAAGADN